MGTDDKRTLLADQGLLNRAADSVADPLFSEDEFFDPNDLLQVRHEMLRCVRSGARSAKDAAKVFGVSRATFYDALSAFERGGIAGLVPRKRGPRAAHKLTDEVIDFVETRLVEEPGCGSEKLAAAIEERFQVSVHRRSVERALERRKKNRSP